MQLESEFATVCPQCPRLTGDVSPSCVDKLRFALIGGPHVRFGSWLCENAKTPNRDRRSYSSKTVLVAQRVGGFNLEIELKNIILRRVSIFEFLHSQGQKPTSAGASAISAMDREADVGH